MDLFKIGTKAVSTLAPMVASVASGNPLSMLLNVTSSASEIGNTVKNAANSLQTMRGDSRAADVVKNWIRNRITLEFLGTWEQIYNPDFKVVEFDHFKSEAGLHTFVLSVLEWIDKTNANRKKYLHIN